MQTKLINDFEVKPVKIKNSVDNSDLPGIDLFKVPFFNMNICAVRNSGKSTVIYNLVAKLANRGDARRKPNVRTHIFIFAGQVQKDPIYIQLVHKLQEAGYCVAAYDSLTDDDGNNRLTDLIESLKEYSPDLDNYLVIIDDLASELKSPHLSQYLKNSRHSRIRTIISSQAFKDQRNDSRNNCEYFLLFKNLPPDYLEELYKGFAIGVSYEDFRKCYLDATSYQHGFLFVDRADNQLRKNFSELYINSFEKE